jgi:hypothetical protein
VFGVGDEDIGQKSMELMTGAVEVAMVVGVVGPCLVNVRECLSATRKMGFHDFHHKPVKDEHHTTNIDV